MTAEGARCTRCEARWLWSSRSSLFASRNLLFAKTLQDNFLGVNFSIHEDAPHPSPCESIETSYFDRVRRVFVDRNILTLYIDLLVRNLGRYINRWSTLSRLFLCMRRNPRRVRRGLPSWSIPMLCGYQWVSLLWRLGVGTRISTIWLEISTVKSSFWSWSVPMYGAS